MPFTGLRQKLAVLDTRLATPAARALPARIAALVGDALQGSRPPSAQEALTLDLTYALTRHAIWLSAPVFTDVVASFLAAEHGLERVRAELLAERGTDEALTALAQARADASALCFAITDDEFLRYVFVESASARDEAALRRDLGLGGELLQRLKCAVLDVSGPQLARYVPELEAKLADVVLDMAKELRQSPWAMDVHRLRYDLVDIADPWRNDVREQGASWMFELLVNLGARRQASAKQLGKKATPALLEELARLGLCFRVGPAGDASPWQLSERGEDLTAAAFARRFVASHQTTPATFAKLSPRYQCQLVSDDERLDATALAALAEHARPIAPLALEQALTRLAARDAPAAHAVLDRLRARAAPAWLDQAVRRVGQALAAMPESGG